MQETKPTYQDVIKTAHDALVVEVFQTVGITSADFVMKNLDAAKDIALMAAASKEPRQIALAQAIRFYAMNYPGLL